MSTMDGVRLVPLDSPGGVPELGLGAFRIESRGRVVGHLLLSDVLRLKEGAGRSVERFFVAKSESPGAVAFLVWAHLRALWPGYWEVPAIAGRELTAAARGSFGDAVTGHARVLEGGRTMRVEWFYPR